MVELKKTTTHFYLWKSVKMITFRNKNVLWLYERVVLMEYSAELSTNNDVFVTFTQKLQTIFDAQSSDAKDPPWGKRFSFFCFFNSLFLIHSFNSLGYYLFHNKQKSIRWLFWGWKWSLSTLGRNDGGKNVAFEGIHRFMEACFHHWIEIRKNMVTRMLFAQTWKLVIWVRC